MSDDLIIAYQLGVEDMRSRLHKQADEIERLRAENEKLRKALEPFADEAECYTDDVLDCFPVGYHTVVENLRTALKMLEGE
jgi:regulator of replication initiation timing